jgi:hypothetical protein
MKYLGVANVILWINISRIFYGLVLSQSHYIEKVLDKFSKGDNNIVKTSMNISVYLSKNKDEEIDQLKYSHIIRTLMCAMNYIRPDVLYSVSKLNGFLSNPSIDKWKALREYSNIWGILLPMSYIILVT